MLVEQQKLRRKFIERKTYRVKATLSGLSECLRILFGRQNEPVERRSLPKRERESGCLSLLIRGSSGTKMLPVARFHNTQKTEPHNRRKLKKNPKTVAS